MTTETLAIRRVPLDSLHLDPSNARQHGEPNLDAIVGSLRRFGQAEPLVVQRVTGRIIGGNGRLLAMRKLGWTECDVVELEVDDLTATALGIALNRTAELATWDLSTLSRLLEELRADDALEGVGYSASDIDDLIDELQAHAALAGEIDSPPTPEPPDRATTHRGDLWVLGDHRLLCGDSARVDDLDRLLAGAEIHLANTDPPYNVKVEPRSNNAIAAGLSSFPPTAGRGANSGRMHHQRFDLARGKAKAKATTKKLRAKDRPLENDFVSDADFEKMLLAWFGNMSRVIEPGRGFYIWGGYANVANYPPALAAVDFYFSQAIIWVKEHPVLTRKDFMGNHEWCFYGWKKGAAHVFLGPANVPDVWSVKKIAPSSMVHLTEKPVELAARAMRFSSRPRENVLDLFGGSGSTLLAAESLDRRCFLMEIDPLYCDVIVTRWQDATGKKAVLEGSDQTFSEIRAGREPNDGKEAASEA